MTNDDVFNQRQGNPEKRIPVRKMGDLTTKGKGLTQPKLQVESRPIDARQPLYLEWPDKDELTKEAERPRDEKGRFAEKKA